MFLNSQTSRDLASIQCGHLTTTGPFLGETSMVWEYVSYVICIHKNRNSRFKLYQSQPWRGPRQGEMCPKHAGNMPPSVAHRLSNSRFYLTIDYTDLYIAILKQIKYEHFKNSSPKMEICLNMSYSIYLRKFFAWVKNNIALAV